MTRDDAIAYVRQGLGFREADTAFDAATLAMMDLVQYEELERGTTLPWFLAVEDEAQVGVASQMWIAFPTGFIRQMEDNSMTHVTSEGRTRFLRKVSYDQLVDTYADEVDGTITEGDPLRYAQRASRWYFAPIPIATWSAVLSYYKHAVLPSVISSGTGTNLWLTNAASVLVNLTGLRMAESTRDPAGEQLFKGRLQAASARLTSETILADYADREFSMGNQA